MDLALTQDQIDLHDALDGLLAKESTTERVRSAEPGGFDADLWQVLRDFGIPDLAGTVSLADLTVIAELCGRHLASAPVVETLAAARRLDDLGIDPAGPVSFAPRPAANGSVRFVPGVAACPAVLCLAGSELLLVETRDAQPLERTVAALGLGHVPTAGARALASGDDAAVHFASGLAEWRVLTAAALVGIGSRGLQLGVDYARTRMQFGQVIGSFQGLAHPLADAATAVDGAQLLVQEAAWALDAADPRGAGLAAMAFAFAVETAQLATGRGLHAHGGYGYTLEYDVQLYFRRARALGLVAGGVGGALDDVAAMVCEPVSGTGREVA